MNLKFHFFLVMYLLTFMKISIAQRVVNELSNEWKFAKGDNVNDDVRLITFQIQ